MTPEEKAYYAGAQKWLDDTGDSLWRDMSAEEIAHDRDIYATAFADGAEWQRKQSESQSGENDKA